MQKNRNFYTHVTSLSLTKLADGLIDPKLVLAWLLTTLGAGPLWVGMLVPVREAGALLPQFFTAEPIRKLPIRKWAWIIGSVIQGCAAAGIGIAAVTLEGALAGAVIVALVAILAIARSISSVSYKDVLGKTVEKSFRGQTSGTAASIAAAGVFVFGFLLMSGALERAALVTAALFLAGVLWLAAAVVFTRLQEEPTAPQEAPAAGIFTMYLSYLKTDTELQKLILARGLLLATAIAPPHLILLAGESAAGMFDQIGALVIAASLATLVSGRVWGVFSDRSTSLVLTTAGIGACATLLVAVLAAQLGWFTLVITLPAILFVLLLTYQGVRIGRSTHLVNIAGEHTRTAYTAISNTIIGVALLATGAFGFLATLTGISMVIGILAGMCLLGALVARTMRS